MLENSHWTDCPCTWTNTKWTFLKFVRDVSVKSVLLRVFWCLPGYEYSKWRKHCFFLCSDSLFRIFWVCFLSSGPQTPRWQSFPNSESVSRLQRLELCYATASFPPTHTICSSFPEQRKGGGICQKAEDQHMDQGLGRQGKWKDDSWESRGNEEYTCREISLGGQVTYGGKEEISLAWRRGRMLYKKDRDKRCPMRLKKLGNYIEKQNNTRISHSEI